MNLPMTGEEPVVSYGHSDVAWGRHREQLLTLIQRHRVRRVCEVGGGANPMLDAEQIRALGLEYTVLDVSAEELAKAPAGLHTLHADICGTLPPEARDFDLVFSKMLAEHVPDAAAFHRNVLQLLRPGGIAFHFFPTLYALPFVANRLLPEALAARILRWFAPRDSHRHAKFVAHYHWCRGPTARQLARLRDAGYEIVSYVGFFGHASYWRRLPPVAALSDRLSRWLVRHPLPWLTSFAWVTLRRPGGA